MKEIEKIKKIMKDKNIKQADLVKILDVDQGKVANWFARGGVPKQHLKEVASILGVTVDYLLT